MTKLILFSEPQNSVLQKIKPDLFKEKVITIAYIPSDGSSPKNTEYTKFWQNYIENNGAKFIMINNSVRGDDALLEANKIRSADALILTGGNTFQFLHHLKESGLDKTIIEFAQTDKTIVGFSAGAVILSSTIEIVDSLTLDENLIGISDLTGLGLIDFDIYPHYKEFEDKLVVDEFEKTTGRVVKRLTNDDFIVIKSKA